MFIASYSRTEAGIRQRAMQAEFARQHERRQLREAREIQRRAAAERIHEMVRLGQLTLKQDRVTGADILKAFAAANRITVRELVSHSRFREAVRLRDAAIRAVFDARQDLSLPQLGRLFGNRDHTTILHSLRKTAKPGCDYRNNPLPEASE